MAKFIKLTGRIKFRYNSNAAVSCKFNDLLNVMLCVDMGVMIVCSLGTANPTKINKWWCENVCFPAIITAGAGYNRFVTIAFRNVKNSHVILNLHPA